MTKERFLALFRWEKPVEMNSVLSVPEVLARLQSITLTSDTWFSLERFTSNAPLAGLLTTDGGSVRLRTSYPSTKPARELVFRLAPRAGGTRLVGVLRLRPALLGYQACVLVAMFLLQGWMIYLWIHSGAPWNWRGAADILQQFGLIPFVWVYIRIGLWWTRKKETRTLELVQAALSSSSDVELCTPTEVFIHPRHETPERMS